MHNSYAATDKKQYNQNQQLQIWQSHKNLSRRSPIRAGETRTTQESDGRRPEKENPNRINHEITAPDGARGGRQRRAQSQVIPIRAGIAPWLTQMELDLIEISPKADPPVCRIADYQKFLYQQKQQGQGDQGQAGEGRSQGDTFRPPDRRPRLQLQAQARRRTSSRRGPRSRPTSSSAAVRSSSRSRAKSCCCASPPTSKSSPRWR